MNNKVRVEVTSTKVIDEENIEHICMNENSMLVNVD